MVIHNEENATTEEQVSRIEGAHEHLATKADVSDVLTAITEFEIRTTQSIDRLRTEDEGRRIHILEERVSYLEGVVFEHLTTKANSERVLIETQSDRPDCQDEDERIPTEKRNLATIISIMVQIANIGVGLLRFGFDLLRFLGMV